jgi:hypothetical protein
VRYGVLATSTGISMRCGRFWASSTARASTGT